MLEIAREIEQRHAEDRATVLAYFRRQLADVREQRKLPQTRDDHATLADRERHYLALIGGME